MDIRRGNGFQLPTLDERAQLLHDVRGELREEVKAMETPSSSTRANMRA